MAPSYRDVMTTDLSVLHTASEQWKTMGEKFGKLKGNYETHVKGALGNGNWTGEGYNAAAKSGTITMHELVAAKTEALAVSDLLDAAYNALKKQKEALKKYVNKLRTQGYRVDPESGQVTTDYNSEKFTSMTPEELRGYKNDPQAIAAAEQKCTQNIKDLVKDIGVTDDEYRQALELITKDKDGKGTKNGFNGNANGKDAKTVILSNLEPSKPGETPKSSYTSESKVTGPDAGVSVTGMGYGKQGMVKAHADLWNADGKYEKTFDNGTKLTGTLNSWGGARASASLGMTDSGVGLNLEASAGTRFLAEGRAGNDFAEGYARVDGRAGAEATFDATVGADGIDTGGRVFAGARGGGALGVEAGGIGVGGTGEAWAGIGAEYDADIKFNGYDGLKVKLEAGAALGLGGKLGMEFTVNPKKIGESFVDAGKGVGDFAVGAKDKIVGIFD